MFGQCAVCQAHRDPGDGEGAGLGMACRYISFRLDTMADEADEEEVYFADEFDQVLDGFDGDMGLAVGTVRDGQVFDGLFDEKFVELSLGLDIFFAFAALDLEQRRLGDVDVTFLDERFHLAVEEGEQEGTDV